jgi:hypothetical protein
MASERKWWQRLLRIEPGIALWQWGYDRIANNWQLLVATFAGLGGMSYLTAITDFMAPYGALGIGAVGIFFFLFIWLVLAWASGIRAKARLNRAQSTSMENWRHDADNIDPMASEYNRKRIYISELVHPITKNIRNKRFIDCDLIGPANIVFLNDCHLTGGGFINCDLMIVKPDAVARNVVPISNIEMIGGTVSGCTIYVQTFMMDTFLEMGGSFATFTGDPAIDNPSPPNTGSRTQP